MELISWSLSAIDKIFSPRSRGPGEPVCPDGTFPAGYTMDVWDKWRVVCLTILSVEDVEDLYLFGLIVAGFLLIGLGGSLVCRKIGKTAARKETPVLSVEIKDCFGAENDSVMGLKLEMTQSSEKVNDLAEKLAELNRRSDNLIGMTNEALRQLAGLNKSYDELKRLISHEAKGKS